MKYLLIFLIVFPLNVANLQQWQQTGSIPPGGGVTDMVITPSGSIIVTTASFNFPNGQMGGIRRSTDAGNTWQSPLNVYNARTLALGEGNTVFASAWNFPSSAEALYISTDDGVTWPGLSYSVGANNNIFSILALSNQVIFIGTRTGVHKSVNGGTAFTAVNNGIPANSWVRDLEYGPDNVIAAATTNGVFISSNNGTSWNQVSGIPQADTIVSLMFDTSSTLDGSNNALVMGSDNNSLYKSFEQSQYTSALLAYIFSGGDVELGDIRFILGMYLVTQYPRSGIGGGAAQSLDQGTSFNLINEGLPVNPKVSAIYAAGTHRTELELFLGLYENTNNGARIYTRTQPIGIQQISSGIPSYFSLHQNYPNPFNPATKINFDLPFDSKVTMKIFDITGREIVTLAKGEVQTAGYYTVTFDGGSIASGVYFYRIIAEGGNQQFVMTKRMAIVK